MSLASFTNAYMDAALWSSTDENDEPMDKNFSASDLASETKARMRRDCDSFYTAHSAIIPNDEQGGHDFWLTRNGHGAGFWDGDYEEPDATTLTQASKSYGEYDLYVGDDGEIYGSGGREKNPSRSLMTLTSSRFRELLNHSPNASFVDSEADAMDLARSTGGVPVASHNIDGEYWAVIPQSEFQAWSRSGERENPATSVVPGIDSWNTYGSGTSAPRGHDTSYDLYLDGGVLAQGRMQYTIDPVGGRTGRFMGYVLRVAGHPANNGLHFTIGSFRTARQAASAAATHYRQNEHAVGTRGVGSSHGVENPSDEFRGFLVETDVKWSKAEVPGLSPASHGRAVERGARLARQDHSTYFYVTNGVSAQTEKYRVTGTGPNDWARENPSGAPGTYRVMTSYGGKDVGTGLSKPEAMKLAREASTEQPVDVWTTQGGHFGAGYVIAHFDKGQAVYTRRSGQNPSDTSTRALGIQRYQQAADMLQHTQPGGMKRLSDGTILTRYGAQSIKLWKARGGAIIGQAYLRSDGTFSAAGDDRWLKKYSPTEKAG